MEDNDLGYFKEYGNMIFAACIILYMAFYSYLSKDYE